MIFFNRFPVRLETPICSAALVKMAVNFTIKSTAAVTTRVSINKEEADLFIKGIFKQEQSVQFTLRSKNYFQVAKTYGFIDTID